MVGDVDGFKITLGATLMIDQVFSIEISAPVERVWDEITHRGSPHQPMFATYLHGDLKAGSVLSYRNKSGSHTFVLGEILEVQAPVRLVHTFRFSMQKDAPTLVVWEFSETNGVTRVTVTHSRFDGETGTYKTVRTSWPKILSLYKQVIETGGVPIGVRLRNAIMMAMCFMLPKRARTEVTMSESNRVPEV